MKKWWIHTYYFIIIISLQVTGIFNLHNVGVHIEILEITTWDMPIKGALLDTPREFPSTSVTSMPSIISLKSILL